MTKNRMSAFEMTLVSDAIHQGAWRPTISKRTYETLFRKAGYSKNRTKYYLKKML
jgi:hypothetical protein